MTVRSIVSRAMQGNEATGKEGEGEYAWLISSKIKHVLGEIGMGKVGRRGYRLTVYNLIDTELEWNLPKSILEGTTLFLSSLYLLFSPSLAFSPSILKSFSKVCENKIKNVNEK